MKADNDPIWNFDSYTDFDKMNDIVYAWLNDGGHITELSKQVIETMFFSYPDLAVNYVERLKDTILAIDLMYDDTWTMENWKQFVFELLDRSIPVKEAPHLSSFIVFNEKDAKKALSFIELVRDIVLT